MPSILEQLAQDQKPNRTCRLCDWLRTRPDDERAEWLIALADKRTYGHSAVARLVKKLDSSSAVSEEIVMNHRSKEHRVEP